jgi:hypothetical protein
MQTVCAVATNDLSSYVAHSDLKQWKETLAVLMFYGGESLKTLVNALAARLEAGALHAAVICYMAAANIDKAVDIWTRRAAASASASSSSSSSSSVPSAIPSASSASKKAGGSMALALHDAIEKISILAVACEKYVARPPAPPRPALPLSVYEPPFRVVFAHV